MRRTVFKSITVISIVAVGAAIGACATAERDGDLDGLMQDQSPTQPDETKLPPSNPTPDASSDAGTTTKDSSTPPPKEAGPPVDSGSSSNNCDPNDPSVILKLTQLSNPTLCPCSASECCFSAFSVCVPK
jgi:hypothetical protein